jgi:uncharacterized damage-inducible protein DinB
MTNKPETLEVWMRGPIAGLSPMLQPVAHAILQVREEINILMLNFPEELLWETPAGVASVGFQLQHLSGVLDRLFTYANDRMLDEDQLELLALEKKSLQYNLTLKKLLTRFNNQVNKALTQLKNTDEKILLEPRGIGRKKIPTNVIGLYFHAAEHTTRHFGALMVTVRVLKETIK